MSDVMGLIAELRYELYCLDRGGRQAKVVERAADALEQLQRERDAMATRIAEYMAMVNKAEAALAAATAERERIGVLHRGRSGNISFIQEIDVLPLGLHETLDIYAALTPKGAEHEQG